MYAEGETELRDLIIQNLESSGFLNKIKAELRAGVFIAFEEEGSLRTKLPIFNKKFDEFIATSNGKLVVSLVREFLEFFNLNFTLSVFDPEIATSSPCLNRTDLCDKLDIKNLDLDGPVISAFLKTKLISTGKETSTESLHPQSTSTISSNSKKSLETISEDSSTKDKSGLDNLLSKDSIGTFSTFDLGSSSLNSKAVNESFTINQKSLDIPKKSSGSEMIDKLRNEHNSSLLNNSSSDIFGPDTSETNIFKVKGNPTLDLDPFFDEPVPSEKQSFFAESGLGLKEVSTNKPSDKKLSSLKDLPALTTSKSKDWSISKELPGLNLTSSEKKVDEEPGRATKSEVDPESTEESSDRQLNSEESIEEDLEEYSSGGMEDLLNSNSFADDATTDQSASQISVVDGVDHIESVNN